MKKNIIFIAIIIMAFVLVGCDKKQTGGNQEENKQETANTTQSNSNNNSENSNKQTDNDNDNNNEDSRSNNIPKDQATQFCEQNGGTVENRAKTLNGKDYGSYDACVMTDNMQCEDWALFHGYCPKTGVKITGYDNDQEVYCAVLGGEVDMKNKECKFNNGAICDLNELYMGQCKQHFNEPATAWEYKYYDNANVLIGYQTNREYIEGIGSKNKDNLLELEINITKVDDISTTGGLGYNKANAEHDQKALKKGDYGVDDIDNPINKSKKVIPLDYEGSHGDEKHYAKELMVLDRNDEECEIDFERIAIFYNNDYQVILRLFGNKAKIISDDSSYFHIDKNNCSNNYSWNTDKQDNIKEQFYLDLANQKITQGAAFNWYNAFDQVTDAVVVK